MERNSSLHPFKLSKVDFKKSTAEKTRNFKSICNVVTHWGTLSCLEKQLTTYQNMEYREEHQISPEAPLALLVEGKQRARHYYRQGDVMRSREGVGASTSSTCARTCWY